MPDRPKDQRSVPLPKLSYAMLEQFFAFGRFLGALGPLLRVSWLLVGVLGWFCRVRARSGVDVGGFGPLPGMFLEPPTLIFSVF